MGMNPKEIIKIKEGKTFKRKSLIIALCILACIGVAHHFLNKKTASTTVMSAKVQVAKAAYDPSLTQGVSSTGSLEAIADVAIKAKVEAPIQQLYAQKNQTVTSGQLLVELEHKNVSAKLAAANAQIEVNSAAATSARAQAANAAKEQERYDILIAKGYTTQQEVASKRTTSKTAGADYNKAMASLASSQADADAAQASLDDYYLRAPFNGVVLDDYGWSLGTKVTVDTNVIRIADISSIKCQVSFPEKLFSQIKEGMTATLVCDSFPDKKFTGKINKVDRFIDTASHTFKAEVLVDNAVLNYQLKPGLFAKVYVVEETGTANTLTVPKAAVRSDNTVFVVENKKVVAKKVQTGISDDKTVAITSGLSEGDIVVTGGGNSLKDGEEVCYNE